MKIAEYRGFIFDLDGVIWRGRQAVPGAAAMIAELRKRDRKVMFVTNLASESRTSQWQKLQSIGIDAELHEVITSGYACALYLKTTSSAPPIRCIQGRTASFIPAEEHVPRRSNAASADRRM